MHYVDFTIIERNIPMHSTLFEGVAKRFSGALASLRFTAPSIPYVPNRLGQIVPEPTSEDFRELLSSHVCRPVLWRRSVDALIESHPGAVLVEVGPRSVLTNLLDRKWHPRTHKLHVDTVGDSAMTRRHIDAVAEMLLRVESGREDVRI